MFVYICKLVLTIPWNNTLLINVWWVIDQLIYKLKGAKELLDAKVLLASRSSQEELGSQDYFKTKDVVVRRRDIF